LPWAPFCIDTPPTVKAIFISVKFLRWLKMKLRLPLGEIQQASAPETAAKTVTPCFYLGLVIANG